MRNVLLLLQCLLITTGLVAQKGKIEGRVTDARAGAPLAGVSVLNKATKAGTFTNQSGYFILEVPAAPQNSLIFSYSGITQQIDDIEVTAGRVTTQDVALVLREKTEEAVVIRAVSNAKKETAAALIAFQKNTAAVAQVISAEAIRRSPDKNTGEVLKRVTGASVQEGKYLVVRGLADRYNQALLNGVLMSSTEPDRKTFGFDIIPSGMIDNIIINKTFLPEFPGEWAGGLLQVNTKDVPSKNFLQVQVGTGFNTQTINNPFYTYSGGNTDFLGYDDGTRALPSNLPMKGGFASLSQGEKTAYAKEFKNIWQAQQAGSNAFSTLNQSLQLNGGFNLRLGNRQKLAAIFSLIYNRSARVLNYENRINTFENSTANLSFEYNNAKYSNVVMAGALANLTLQLNDLNRISFKNILNVNSSDNTTLRTGKDFDGSASPLGDNVIATELAFKANTFFNTQLAGDHTLRNLGVKFHWFGSFNILDQYIPDQRRLQYTQLNSESSQPFLAAIGASNASQKSGSRYYGFLNDYVYTTGADIAKAIQVNSQDQTIKAGYFFQVKDRLFDSRPFAIYLPADNEALRALPADEIFNAINFGNGTDNRFAFNELAGNSYRYVANSILNAGFLQFDQQIASRLRIVWGMRIENFDQVIGSMKKSDPRHVHSMVTDYLPGINITYKTDTRTNIRLSASQTVVRPEFRELSNFQFYDFDMGATIAGFAGLMRTKVSNFDLRYELYPQEGELITIGGFYKYFQHPIEAVFNASSGGASTYNFLNAKEANSFGAELEFRKRLSFLPSMKNFTLQGNLSYIYNRVSKIGDDEERPMQGQSPYLLNASVYYDLQKLGLSTTLLFNLIGRRIAYVGGNDQPPIWENPRPLLDVQIARKVLHKKGEVKLSISDVLNTPAIFYNDLNRDKKYSAGDDAFAIRRKLGTTVSASFAYHFK